MGPGSETLNKLLSMGKTCKDNQEKGYIHSNSSKEKKATFHLKVVWSSIEENESLANSLNEKRKRAVKFFFYRKLAHKRQKYIL